MKSLLLFASLFAINAIADVKSDEKELRAIGQRILKTSQGGATDWSCVGTSGRDFCKIGADHYNKHKEEIKVTGEQFKAYITSLQKNEAAEKKCLDPVFDKGKFKSQKWEEYQAAIDCVKVIDYEVAKPDDVDLFYFKATDLFSQHNIEVAVNMLTEKRNELNPKLKDDVENEVVTKEEFKTAQKEQKEAEKKASKHPAVLAAQTYLSNPKAHVGKKYRIMLLGDGVTGMNCKKGSCEFSYIRLNDAGFGQKEGDGHYRLTCGSRKDCNAIEGIEGQDVSGLDAIVEFRGTVELTTKTGTVLRLPMFTVKETY